MHKRTLTGIDLSRWLLNKNVILFNNEVKSVDTASFTRSSGVKAYSLTATAPVGGVGVSEGGGLVSSAPKNEKRLV